MYYAKSTGCTYLEQVNGKDMPSDAVLISKERYDSVIANPDPTKLRSHDNAGLPILIDMPIVWETGHQLSDKLNDTLARVYSTWTRFESEYVFREQAAIAYKASNYSGVCSVWITAFATAANLSSKSACDLILEQAVGLRSAQETLGALRMRKYELLPLTEQDALDKYNEIDATIQQALSLIS